MEHLCHKRHYAYQDWHSTLRATTINACLGYNRSNICSLLPSMWNPERLFSQDSELSSQLSRSRMLKSPFIMNTAALILSQKCLTHTKEKKIVAQSSLQVPHWLEELQVRDFWAMWSASSWIVLKRKWSCILKKKNGSILSWHCISSPSYCSAKHGNSLECCYCYCPSTTHHISLTASKAFPVWREHPRV